MFGMRHIYVLKNDKNSFSAKLIDILPAPQL